MTSPPDTGHADVSPAYGLISNVGIVALALSCGAAAIGRLAMPDAPAPVPRLLLWIAVLTLVLAVDDLLLLHETAAFAAFAGALTTAAYGLAFLRFVVRFRDVIVRELDVGLLLLAVGAFGVSAVTDLLVAPTQASVFVEDGAKLLGLVAWSAFGLRTTLFAFGQAGMGADARAGTTRQAALR